MKTGKSWGWWKFRFERTRGYINLATFFVTTAILFRQESISFWWLVPCSIAFILVAWFDWKKIYPDEAKTSFAENPEWQLLLAHIEEIKNNGKSQNHSNKVPLVGVTSTRMDSGGNLNNHSPHKSEPKKGIKRSFRRDS